MNKKRKTIYKGSNKNWALMMNKIYGTAMCKFKASDVPMINVSRE